MRLVVLTAVFLLLCGVSFICFGEIAFSVAGRLALSAMFMLSGVLHSRYREGIYLTYPSFLSQTFRINLVFAISDLQFSFALAFIFADVARIITLFVLIYLFLGLFTQIKACIKNISVKRGNYTGNGIYYLLFKIPEQLFIICWTYYFGVVL
ncbi:MAG TPA: hypothetical protein VL125_03875 [Pelobium sp.]|nr:hypothetical protein [Pelobium sp.]